MSTKDSQEVAFMCSMLSFLLSVLGILLLIVMYCISSPKLLKILVVIPFIVSSIYCLLLARKFNK